MRLRRTRARQIEVRVAQPATGIDAEMLERLARIARDLPGHTISVDNDEGFDAPPESQPVLRIDGMIAAEILERCFDDVG